MSIKKVFQNPFILAGNGFIAGALLFWSVGYPDSDPVSGSSTTAAAPAKNAQA